MAEQKHHVLAIGDEDLAVIAAGLNELPRKLSEPVLQRLQAQLDAEKKVEAPVEKSEAAKAALATSASRARRG